MKNPQIKIYFHSEFNDLFMWSCLFIILEQFSNFYLFVKTEETLSKRTYNRTHGI